MKDIKKMMEMLSDEGSRPEMDDVRAQAKMEVIQELLEMAMDKEADDYMGDMDEMKKVTVAAPDEESLMEGLEKAEEVVEEMPEMDESMEDAMEDDEEDDEEEEM